MPIVLGTNLVRTPDVCGGRLRIDGTRMTVNQIVALYHQGLRAEEIVEQYPQRTLSEIYSVLAWYHANKDQVDKEMADEAAAEAHAHEEQEAGRRACEALNESFRLASAPLGGKPWGDRDELYDR